MENEKLIKKVYDHFHDSVEAFSPLHKEMKKDFEFAHGEQWDSRDKQILEERWIKPLTINKIKPNVRLLSGIERQSRSDIVAFPEGAEDTIVSEIATRLIKNISKRADSDRKLSSVFKNGTIEGMRFIEPYIDYSNDIINGELKLREVVGSRIFLDPDFSEYDLSDCGYLIKFSENLSEEDILELFPKDGKKLLEKVTKGSVFIGATGTKTAMDRNDYPDLRNGDAQSGDLDHGYDLVEYYYKEFKDVYYIADLKLGRVREADSKEEAETFVSRFPDSRVIVKKMPVIKLCQLVGDVVFSNSEAWSYPSWKSFPFIPYFYELTIADVKKWELKIQGFVRGMRDLQEEFNKRRTQELKHLNSTASSGYWVTKGSLKEAQIKALQERGSSGGFVGIVEEGAPDPRQIMPAPLSQGHAQLAEEHAQDMKESTGINPDLLANDSQSQSGRAILLKQRQGLVMVQEPLDNYGYTKRILGRFLLSQLSEVYSVETAVKVLGDAFIKQNFQVPVKMIYDRARGKQQTGQELTGVEADVLRQFDGARSEADFANPDGSPVTIVDPDEAGAVINNVLNDSSLGKFDVTIGEGVYTETVRLSEFLSAQELANVVPIPPDVLVELSNLPEAQKRKVLKAIEQQQALAARGI